MDMTDEMWRRWRDTDPSKTISKGADDVQESSLTALRTATWAISCRSWGFVPERARSIIPRATAASMPASARLSVAAPERDC